MNIEHLESAIEQFYKTYPLALKDGRVTQPDEFKGISEELLRIIPDWYKRILLKYPLVDFKIGIPNDHGQEEFIGKPMTELPLIGMTFLSIEQMSNDAKDLFPDFELIEIGILKIAEDTHGTQEGIFIDTRLEDPEVRLVFHDFGETGEEVFAESELLVDTFPNVFKYGKTMDMQLE